MATSLVLQNAQIYLQPQPLIGRHRHEEKKHGLLGRTVTKHSATAKKVWLTMMLIWMGRMIVSTCPQDYC